MLPAGAAEQTAPADTAPRTPRRSHSARRAHSGRSLLTSLTSHTAGQWHCAPSTHMEADAQALVPAPGHGPPGGTASTGTRGQLTSKLVSSLALPQTPTQEALCPEGLLSPHVAATPSGRGHRMTCSWDHSHQATCHPSRSQKAQLPVRPREPQRLWGTHPHSGPVSWGTK